MYNARNFEQTRKNSFRKYDNVAVTYRINNGRVKQEQLRFTHSK